MNCLISNYKTNQTKARGNRFWYQSVAFLICLLSWECQILAGDTEVADWKRYSFQRVRMGVPWTISLYAESPEIAIKSSDSAFRRLKELDRCMSDYDSDSEVRRLCRLSGPQNPVQISSDLAKVLKFSWHLSQRTHGQFDVTVGQLTELWRKAWRKQEFPDPLELAMARQTIGYRSICFQRNNQIRLLKSHMQIDLGALAKGYAADEAYKTLQHHGVHSALIDGSGDIVLGDPPPQKEGWRIGISPLDKPYDEPQEFLRLSNCAVATSGDALRHVEIEGTRYSHLVDPKSGLGLTHSSRVTVIAKSGMAADALSSALSVIEEKEFGRLLYQYQAEALVLRVDQNQTSQYESRGFKQYRSDENVGHFNKSKDLN